METLIGIERKIGESTDRQTGRQFSWNNFVFHLLETDEGSSQTLSQNGDYLGNRVRTEKIRVSDVDVDNLPPIGSNVRFTYNRFGKAEGIYEV